MERDCLNCGEAIAPARLKAIPGTAICVDCQQANEKAGRFQRHVMDVQPVIKCGEMEHLEEQIVRAN